MACESNRGRYFRAVAGQGSVSEQTLHDCFDSACGEPTTSAEASLCQAQTRMLFGHMRRTMADVPDFAIPAHGVDGLPRARSQRGYAAVWRNHIAPTGRRTAQSEHAAEPVSMHTPEPLLAAARAPRTPKGTQPAQFVKSAASSKPGVGADGYVISTTIPTRSPAPGAYLRPLAATISTDAEREMLHTEITPAIVKSVIAVANLANTVPLMPSDPSWTKEQQRAMRVWVKEENIRTTHRAVVDDLARSLHPLGDDTVLGYWTKQTLRHRYPRAAFAAAVATQIGVPRCSGCGQFVAKAGMARHQCNKIIREADFLPDPESLPVFTGGVVPTDDGADETPSVSADDAVAFAQGIQDLAASTGNAMVDPLNNPALAAHWAKLATIISGNACTVRLVEGGGFATNMRGGITADPYPLGKEAPIAHNMLITQAGIYHEIGHELTTPPEDWQTILDIAQGRRDEPGIDAGKSLLPMIYNIVEDGRMEREMSNRFAGVAEVLAASCVIEPRWHEQVGAGVPLTDEVVWPLLYTALPYYQVRNEVRTKMTSAGRALFEDLEPLARKGALGSPDDSLAAAIEITRRLEAAGCLKSPEKNPATPPPPPPPGTQGRPQEPKPADAPKPSDAAGQPDADAPKPSDTGAPKPRTMPVKKPSGTNTMQPPTNADVAQTLRDVMQSATESVVQETTRVVQNTTPEAMGVPLHVPLTTYRNRKDALNQRYLDASGSVQEITTGIPMMDTPIQTTYTSEAQRARHVTIGGKLARQLEAIRTDVQTNLRMETRGKLDRRRLVAAMRGVDTIRTQTTTTEETGMAVSILLDQSGSMGEHITSGAVYDAACTIGYALEQLDMPYEVRGHGGSSMQYKSIGDTQFDPLRARCLAHDNTGSNEVTAPVFGLAKTALASVDQPNKTIISLMDGAMDDHLETVAACQAARKAGIMVFGVYLTSYTAPSRHDSDRMDEIFGRKNWSSIQSLDELPKQVGKRISDVFEQMTTE